MKLVSSFVCVVSLSSLLACNSRRAPGGTLLDAGADLAVDDMSSTDMGGSDMPSGPALCSSGDCDTVVLVAHVINYAEQHEDGTLPGLNLDGTDATVCAQMDSIAPDGTTGVDNSVGPTLAGLIGSMTQDEADAGSRVILIEIAGIDDATNDAHVQVTLYRGHGVGELLHDGEGRLAAGQAFDIYASSFSDVAHTLPRFRFALASIVDGHLVASMADVPASMPLLGESVLLEMHRAQFTADMAELGITNGVLGGAFRRTEVQAAFAAHPSLNEYVATIDSVFEAFADMEPNIGGTDCAAASAAYELEAVTATLSGMIVED